MRDGAKLAAEIAHLVRAQIMLLAQIEKALHLGWHQAHRLVDVGRRAADRGDARPGFGQVTPFDPRNPGCPGPGTGRAMPGWCALRWPRPGQRPDADAPRDG